MADADEHCAKAPKPVMDMECLACQNRSGNRTFAAREMMFGTRDRFEYLECSACGSLQIAKIPDDLGKYYPHDYYSFYSQRDNALRRFLKRKRAEHALGNRQLIGAIMCWVAGQPEFREWLEAPQVRRGDSILDVGCGGGHLLRQLQIAGFTNLQGVDPFLSEDVESDGVRLRKAFLQDLTGPYDFIMLHHSFEHMSDPKAVLKEIYRLLRPGKFALVRCPVAGSYAWRTYGPQWVQLDPPRHLFIPSLSGFTGLARRCGFEVAKTTCDSTEFQFTGSELYRRDVPLRSSEGAKAFSRAQLRGFNRKAKELNQIMDGDSACFYVRKPCNDASRGSAGITLPTPQQNIVLH